jgi:hypothetical protein
MVSVYDNDEHFERRRKTRKQRKHLVREILPSSESEEEPARTRPQRRMRKVEYSFENYLEFLYPLTESGSRAAQ